MKCARRYGARANQPCPGDRGRAIGNLAVTCGVHGKYLACEPVHVRKRSGYDAMQRPGGGRGRSWGSEAVCEGLFLRADAVRHGRRFALLSRGRDGC